MRLVEEAGVAAIAMHPRSAAVQHKGAPDYALVRRAGRAAGADAGAPVIVSGGLDTAEAARRAYLRVGRRRGDDRPRSAREPVDLRGADRPPRGPGPPTRAEIVDELLWTMERAEEHLGPERAARYARKFYPWYLERLGVRGRDADAFQRTESLDEARDLLASLGRPLAVAA